MRKGTGFKKVELALFVTRYPITVVATLTGPSAVTAWPAGLAPERLTLLTGPRMPAVPVRSGEASYINII